MTSLHAIHPVIPDKTCPKCQSEPVKLATELAHVIYYNCETCQHVWAEPRPVGSIPPVGAYL